MKSIYTLITLLTMAGALNAQVLEQMSSHKGLNLAAGLGYSSNDIEDFYNGPESGFALGLEANYGITEWIAPLLAFELVPSVTPDDPSGMLDNYSFSTVRLGARFTPGQTTTKLRPFGSVAVGFNSSTQEIPLFDQFGNVFIEEFDVTSSGLSLDLGLMYFINPYLSLKVQGQYDFGTTDEIENEELGISFDEFDYSNVFILAGLQYNLAL